MLSERSEHETEEEKRKAQKEEKAKGNRSGSSASFKPEKCLGRFASFWPDSDKENSSTRFRRRFSGKNPGVEWVNKYFARIIRRILSEHVAHGVH